jgi:hypothetical protein
MTTNDAFVYQNRMGKVYYLLEGTTPTGKSKYYMAQRVTGEPLAVLPEGYEIYEKPDTAQVLVRKLKPSLITEFERRQTAEIVRRTSGLEHCIIAIENDSLVVYAPSVSPAEADEIVTSLAGPVRCRNEGRFSEKRENRIKRSRYEPMLRFELTEPKKRLYRAERWCFRGSIDGWISLHRTGALAGLVEALARHLGRDSFFELI